jgi:DNA-binding PadR family transcriptional regulator
MPLFPKPLIAASLEPIMLTLLAEHAMYGYDIIQHVHELSDGRIRWSASKLYPLLHSLENKHFVEAFWQPSEAGPDRKYYRLTPGGRRALLQTKRDWLAMNHLLVRLWGPEASWVPA